MDEMLRFREDAWVVWFRIFLQFQFRHFMVRYKIVVEYDGTRYSGWQVQQNAKSIQGMLITAAKTAFDGVGEVMGSGRTDAGVHALGQVVHADLQTTLQPERIIYALNDNLPHDINVRSVTRVDKRFHARHHATGRSYIYQISKRRTAFGKNYIWWIKDQLDVGAMRRGLLAATGMHDYRAFTDAELDATSGKVLVESLDLLESEDFILVRIRASHFLRKMARRVVGTLVEIGRGNLKPGNFSEALEDSAKHEMNFTAPPSGLYLEQVIYKGESYNPELAPAVSVGRMR
jgi:tRNA pseudouridine38-40 synthase